MGRYLITGSSGVVGSRCAVELLHRGHYLILFLRPRKSQSIEDRWQSIAQFYKIDKRFDSQVQLVQWEMSKKDLGLDSQTAQKVFSNIDGVIHAAASVHLNQTIEQARENSLESTKTLFQLLRRWSSPERVQKIEYVSTVGVSGRSSLPLKEEPVRSLPEFHNTYEQAKFETELFVTQSRREGWTVTIHRPSMVVGDSLTGAILSFQVFYYILDYIAGIRSNGWVPDLKEKTLDIIPVDYVALSIVESLLNPKSAIEILHLCSGPDQAQSLKQLQTRYRQFLQTHRISISSLKVLSPRLLRSLYQVGALIPFLPQQKKFRAALPLLDYLQTEQSFENKKSLQHLEQFHINLPDPNQYLDPILSIWMEQQNGRV
ncbi:MAG: SDR family oxidoreductase [Bdellovibrionales bacterium]|nr:SDR family oxidoreductase [Bdellovibrionales bacterium]